MFGAAIIDEGDFTLAELRAVRKKIKGNKVSGTDEIPNEIILLLLSFSQGFTLVLSLMNQMWRTESYPDEFDVGRIAALFKGGRVTDSAAQYRPISILQGLYKLFTTLVD